MGKTLDAKIRSYCNSVDGLPKINLDIQYLQSIVDRLKTHSPNKLSK